MTTTMPLTLLAPNRPPTTLAATPGVNPPTCVTAETTASPRTSSTQARTRAGSSR